MIFHKRLPRSLWINIAVIISLPAAYFTIKTSLASIGEPELYEGDLIEVRDCRRCAGTGRDEDQGMGFPALGRCCRFCGGRGTVKVLLPGPRRPTRIWAVVVDAEARDGFYRDHTPGNLRRINPASSLLSGSPSDIPGGIAGAKVVFTPLEGKALELKTDRSGRFSRRLPPGAYRVKVTASGFEPLEGKIEVEPLTEPIWLEKATRAERPGSEAEARSRYGLHLLAGLSRAGEGRGLLRVSLGSP